MLIAIANHKGGTGKSTLTLNLFDEMQTAIIDADKKKTLSKLLRLRDESTVVALDVDEKNLFSTVESHGGLIIADCGGYDSDYIQKILALADIVITPVTNEITEMLELAAFNSTLKKISEIIGRDINCHVLPYRINPRTKNITELELLVEQLDQMTLMQSIIRSRKDYPNAASFGYGTTKCKSTKYSIAAKEIRSLCDEIKHLIDIE